MSDKPFDPNNPEGNKNEKPNDGFGWSNQDAFTPGWDQPSSGQPPQQPPQGYGQQPPPYGYGQPPQQPPYGYGQPPQQPPYGYGQQPPPDGQYVFGYGYGGGQQPQAPSYTWFEAWRMAILQPSLETYQKLLADPKSGSDRGFTWLAIAILISSVISAIAQAIIAAGLASSGETLFNFSNTTTTTTTTGTSTGGSLIANLICGVPLQIVFGLIAIIILVAIVHVAARIFGGQAQFEKTLYGYSLIYSPYYILSGFITLAISPLSFAPIGLIIAYIGLAGIGLLVAIYGVYLQTIAIKAAHGIGWGESFIAALSPLLLVCFCFFACVGTIVLAGVGASA